MSDLRRRLAEALLAHRHVDLLSCECGWGPPQRSAADLAAHQSNAVLSVLADWLRERARESARSASDWRDAAAMRRLADEIDSKEPVPPKVPCPEGFHWIGQSFARCDECGLPAWEHDGTAALPAWNSDGWVLRPWKPGQREACRAKWETKGADGGK